MNEIERRKGIKMLTVMKDAKQVDSNIAQLAIDNVRHLKIHYTPSSMQCESHR